MSDRATMTLNLTPKEMDALESMCTEKDMSKTAVMRQALRFYQMAYERIKAGETMHFSGDEQRRIEFVGIYP